MCHWIVEVRCCSPDLRHSTVQWLWFLARKVSFSANRSAQIESQDRSYDVLLCKKSDFSFGGVFCCFSKSTFNHPPPPPPPFPLVVVCCTLDRNAVSCHAAVAVAAAAQWCCIRIVVDGWMVAKRFYRGIGQYPSFIGFHIMMRAFPGLVQFASRWICWSCGWAGGVIVIAPGCIIK